MIIYLHFGACEVSISHPSSELAEFAKQVLVKYNVTLALIRLLEKKNNQQQRYKSAKNTLYSKVKKKKLYGLSLETNILSKY